MPAAEPRSSGARPIVVVWELTAVGGLAAVVLLISLWLLASGTAAQAHAVLRSSDPADWTSVERAPLGHLQR
jgi:hypothetical protein